MRRPVIALAGALLALSRAHAAGQGDVLQRVGESLVKIEAGDHAASGFLWGDPAHAVTSLHVVDGAPRITAHFVGPAGTVVASSEAVVERVLKESDLVLLRLRAPHASKVLVASATAPAVKQSLDAVGFPLNIPSCSNTEVKVRFGGNQLRSILPPKVLALIRDYPSPTVEILNLEGNLVPGLSGAPIVDAEGRVVGVADGGLEAGAIGISWGIPASHLERLARSPDTRLPGAAHVAQLFAADLQADVGRTRTVGGLRLTKLRSRTYRQLAETADDKLGLGQLTGMFAMFGPEAFRYDIYQELDSGATVAVPQGASFREEDGFTVVTVGVDRMLMKLRIQGVSGFPEAQTRSQEFEQQLVNPQGELVAPDPAWSYLQPMTRFGVLVNRKALAAGLPSVVGFQPHRYFFETLATNGRTLLAVAAVNQDSSVATMQAEALCGQGLIDPRCERLRKERRVWAQMALGVQFSSFPHSGM